jgi:hypothetical protein
VGVFQIQARLPLIAERAVGPMYDLFAYRIKPSAHTEYMDRAQIHPSLEEFHRRYSLLQYLLTNKCLRDVTIVNLEAAADVGWDWNLLPFRNLRKLHLHGRSDDDPMEDGHDIAQVLLSSPEHTSLGLSACRNESFPHDFLRRFIKNYEPRREALHIPLLRLSELHLGYGFLPIKPEGSF